MKPDKATVYEIFQLEKRYVVPLYQRPYVWNADDHWGPLWEDIEGKAVAMALGESAAPHFLGAVVLSQIKVALRQISASQVIDGQQRLTTLQVVLAVFRDVVGALAVNEADPDTKDTLDTIFKMLSQTTEHPNVLGAKEDRFKVWPTNADRPEYEAVMTARSRAAVEAKYPIQFTGQRKKMALPGPRLVEAYRFFDTKIRAFIAPTESTRTFGTKEAALGLFEAVRRCLQIVVIDLDEGDDPQVIFETLNARGEPLLPSDLIRNVVFNRAGKDADALYESHWRQYDANKPDGTPGFWKAKVKQGRELRPVLDLFFHSYLSCRAEKVVPLAHLYKEYRTWWDAQKDRPLPAILDELNQYSGAYHTFHDPTSLKPEDERLATFAKRLHVLDTAMVYPLLLHLVVALAEQITRPERDAILTDLESFLVRRWICNQTTKNYNRLFIALLHDLRGMKVLDRTAFRSRLAQITGVDHWPDDKEFESVWLRERSYTNLGSSGVQMVLGAVHDAMLTKKQEKVTIPAVTVEHVMPLAWRNHWPTPPQIESPPAQDETGEDRRDRIIHTFGNLTLLTQELNSDVRDSAYGKKRPAITKESLLLLNSYFQDVGAWDDDAILKRGRDLFQHAKTIWPAPPTNATPA